MASTHKHIRSSTANKRPTTAIADGQIALNTNSTSPGLFFKDSTGATIIKVGPVHVGTTAPNVSPAAGGSSGNSTGEVWLDTSLTPNGVKIWNGASWTNATPIGSTTVQGLLELATNAETQTGTDPDRAVTPAGLQSKVSDSTSTTSSTTIASSTAVKAAYDLANAAIPTSGGTVTGNLEIGTTGSLTFEGSTANGFETTLAVVDPTADQTITLPNVTGTVITTGDTGTVTSTMIANGTIVNDDINASAAIAYSKLNLTTSIVDGDISATAEIAVSKLADGTARQLLQTDSAGTGVEWTSNVDVPGTLDVTGAAVFDSTANIAGNLTVDTNTLFVDATNNRVGVGTATPGAPLDVVGSANTVVLSSSAADATTKEAKIQCRHYTSSEENVMLLYGASTSTQNFVLLGGGSSSQNSANYIGFLTAANNTTTSGSERGRWDSSGRLLVGTSSSTAEAKFIVQGGTTASGGAMNIQRSLTTASAGSTIGYINFTNSANDVGATVSANGDGTWSAGTSHPTNLTFSTTAGGASSPTERMRIGSDGTVYIHKNNVSFGTAGTVLYGGSTINGAIDLTRSAAYSIAINRLTSDGNLIEFYRDSALQGTISVSGSTVSYNGAHLSRWSQLSSGVERTEILRGTILSNIDEMCKWGEEENEQLNRMKVSDVEGDKNVSGVFQAWDDDDDTYTNDFYCAMTGDFIIRIGAGVTVERGDLLMSAGDGTAKPQDDDIIRSKTIAKVTSTNVSCTYPDGSFCVPCVLMAC